MNDAILMTALQSSDSRVAYEAQNLGDLCLLVLSSLQNPVGDKGLRVDMELPAEGDWIGYFDRELIVIALEKLLRNAVQHNYPGGRVRIREATLVPDSLQSTEIWPKPPLDLPKLPAYVRDRQPRLGWRTIEIFNTGPVIPEEKLDKLFRKFELVGRIEHHQKGSGLSLPIVQAVLENHGGRVAVESYTGTGNFFYLTVPVLELRPVSGDQQGQGFGGAAADEEIGVVADPARREVELQHAGAGAPRDGHQAGGRIDRA